MLQKLKMSLALASTLAFLSVAASAATPSRSGQVYIAHLEPLNVALSSGSRTTGEARFTVKGGKLIIDIKVTGAPPDMTHWQHFHGLTDGRAAACPSEATDTNGDHIIDLIETEAVSGVTMVPFDDDPAAMNIAHGSYPRSSAGGAYTYHRVVSLKALSAAFSRAFDGQRLDLDKRVIYIHGVPADTRLPSTVATLGAIPAQVTLPIACGKIERVGG